MEALVTLEELDSILMISSRLSSEVEVIQFMIRYFVDPFGGGGNAGFSFFGGGDEDMGSGGFGGFPGGLGGIFSQMGGMGGMGGRGGMPGNVKFTFKTSK
jgi:hypothetical protein